MIKLRVHIIGCILIISTSIASAQEYIPMNFDNGRWFVDVFKKGGYVEEIQMYCKGDTVIEDQKYYKLFQNKLTWDPYGDLIPDTTMGQYPGAIRNGENKQVLFWNFFEDSATVIYDFNLSIGDTIKGLKENFIIDDIDSVEYCGIYRKRYSQHRGGIILTEGIGHANGLLGYFYPFNNSGESTRVLECYTEKNNLECPICENLLSVSVNNISTEIYPNPISGRSVIEWSQSFQPENLNVYDLTGRIIYSKSIGNANNSYIDRSDLEKGVLVLELVDNEGKKYKQQIIVL